jgi:hypothetical protein
VRFSARPKADAIFQEVRAGIIRNVSVGYITHAAEELDRTRGQLRVVRATRWEPLELSLVAVPADPGAIIRSRTDARYPCAIIRRRGMQTSTLPRSARAGAVDDALVADVNRMFDEAEVRVAAARDRPSVPRTSAAAMSRALLYQQDPARHPLPDAARSLAGFRPYELARRALESAGVRTSGLTPYELAGLALGLVRPDRVRGDGFLTTSDFPAAMLALARATLTDGYLGAPRTFPAWTRRTTLPDFRPMNRIALGMVPRLLLTPSTPSTSAAGSRTPTPSRTNSRPGGESSR